MGSVDVSNQSMIDDSIIRNQQAYNNHMVSKGKGKGDSNRYGSTSVGYGSSSLGSGSSSLSRGLTAGLADPYAAHAAHYANTRSTLCGPLCSFSSSAKCQCCPRL